MVVAARQKEVCRYTRLPAPGKKGRIDKRPESRWRKEKKTFRQGDKVAPMNDVDFLIIRLRRHQPTGQSKPFAKPQCPRFFRNERIGTGFDEEITASPRARGVRARLSQSRSAHGFSVMKESGPASTRKSPTFSVAIEPPRRCEA